MYMTYMCLCIVHADKRGCTRRDKQLQWRVQMSVRPRAHAGPTPRLVLQLHTLAVRDDLVHDLLDAYRQLACPVVVGIVTRIKLKLVDVFGDVGYAAARMPP